METLFILIPLSILLVILIGALLVWAIRSGQYDDLERPRHEMFLDDDDGPSPAERKGGNGNGNDSAN